MDIQSFDFDRLPKISRQEAELLEGVQSYLPRTGFSEKIKSVIQSLVTRELGMPFSFRQERLTTVSLADKVQSLPRQGVYAVFGMEPLGEKAFLELDPLLSHIMIDKLMGGSGEPLTMIRPLTEIETGVLSYLFLKIFSEIFARLGKTARVHFRLEGLFHSPDEVMEKLGGGGAASVVLGSIRLHLGNRAGYARLFLPLPFVHEILLDPVENPDEASEREAQYFWARLKNLEYIPTSLWAEIGRSTLKAGSVNRLESGDVILLEQTGARSEAGRLSGSLSMRVGRGEHGAFRAEVVPDQRTVKLKIMGLDLE